MLLILHEINDFNRRKNNDSSSDDIYIGKMDTIIVIDRGYILLLILPFVVHVDPERRSSLDQFHAMIPQNMIYSADQIRLSNTIGQGTLYFMLM